MSGASKISVLVPVYKDEAYLDKLLEQLSENDLWELVVVADSPSRETLEVLEKYGKRLSV